MGQAQSRRTSTSSQTPLNPSLSAEKVQEAFYSSANPRFRDDLVSPNVITRPVRPSHTYRFSELIDPHDLLGLTADDTISVPEHSNSIGPPNVNKRLPKLIESPSGHTLGPHEFIARSDRPLAIRERQENIRQAVENASRNGSRNGSLGIVGSETTGSVGSKRNASVGTFRSNMTFEETRIEEGRRAYEEKMRAASEPKNKPKVLKGLVDSAETSNELEKLFSHFRVEYQQRQWVSIGNPRIGGELQAKTKPISNAPSKFMSSSKGSGGYVPPHLRHLHTVATSKPAHIRSLLDDPKVEQKALPPHLRIPSKASPQNVDTKTGSFNPTQATASRSSSESRRGSIPPQSKIRAQGQLSASRASLMSSIDQDASTLIQGLSGPSAGCSAPKDPKPSESGIADQSIGTRNKHDLANLEPLIPLRAPMYGLDLDAEHTELELLPPRLWLQSRPAEKVHNTPSENKERISAEKKPSATERGPNTTQIPIQVLPHLRGLEIPTVPTKSGESSSTLARSVGMASKSEMGSSKAGTSVKEATIPELQKIRTGDAALWVNKTKNMPPAKMSKAHPCPYEGCNAGYDTVRLLRMHKEDRHDRCRKCDLDFKDFQEYLDHKIQSPEHITCPLCGEDFRSSGGRDAHMLAIHPNEQDICCPGCGKLFIRAGSLVDHLEKNECPGITIAYFDRYRTVHALREQFLSTLSKDDEGGVSHLTAQTATETIGGVALERDQVQYKAAWPSVAPEPIPSPQNGSSVEDQSHRRTDKLSAGTSKKNLLLGVAGSSSSSAESVLLTRDIVSSHEDKGKWLAHTDEGKAKAPAWSGASSAAKTPFPEPERRNIQKVLAEMLIGTPQEAQISQFANGQPLAAANPDSRHYNPGAFRNILGTYKCPHPGCARDFPLESNFEAHLRSLAHNRLDYRCPECLKIFKSSTAIIQHMEASGSRCRVKESKNFGKIVALATGGILTVEGLHVDGTVRYQAREPEW